MAPSDMMDNRIAAIKRRLADAGLASKVSPGHHALQADSIMALNYTAC